MPLTDAEFFGSKSSPAPQQGGRALSDEQFFGTSPQAPAATSSPQQGGTWPMDTGTFLQGQQQWEETGQLSTPPTPQQPQATAPRQAPQAAPQGPTPIPGVGAVSSTLSGRMEDETVRPAVEAEKEKIKAHIAAGTFFTDMPGDDRGDTREPSYAADMALKAITGPGVVGGAAAGASMLSELPRLAGAGAGALGGGARELKNKLFGEGGDILEGMKQGASFGSEVVKQNIPSIPVFSKEGVRYRAMFELALDELTEYGGDLNRAANKINPIYHMLPQNLKDEFDAIATAIGAGAVNIFPFLAGRGGPKAGLKPALDNLKAIGEKQTQGPEVPKGVEPYVKTPIESGPRTLSDAEFLTPEVRAKETGEPINPTPKEREAIIAKEDLVAKGEEIVPTPPEVPKRITGRIDPPGGRTTEPVTPIDPRYSGAILERSRGLEQVARDPWELRGDAGAEGPRPIDAATHALRQLRDDNALNSFNPLDLFNRLYGDKIPPFQVLKNLRERIGTYTETLERLQKQGKTLEVERMRGKIAGIHEQLPIVLDAVKDSKTIDRVASEAPGSRTGTILRSINPADLDVASVIDALMTEFGGSDRKTWTTATKKNAADWAQDVMSKRAKSDEMKEKYLKAARILRGEEQQQQIQGKDIRSFDPTEAVAKIIEVAKSESAFTKKLIETYGEDIRPYASTLYAHAKQQEREASTSARNPLKAEGQERPQVLSSQSSQTAAQRLIDLGGWDKRSGIEIKSEFLREDSPIKDLTDDIAQNLPIPQIMKTGIELAHKMARGLDQGQSYARNHPIMNWVYSKLDMTERDINRTVNQIMYGENFVTANWRPFGKFSSLRRAVREADPDSMMYKYNQLKGAQQENVRKAADKFNGVEEPSDIMLSNEGLTRPEIDAYRNLRKGFDKFWDEVLAPVALKVGFELPQKIPGYFPMTWFGDYRVWGKNKIVGDPNYGKYDIAYGVNSISEAKAIIKEMTEKHPTHEFLREDVTNVHKEFTSTPEAFLDAIRLFGRNSETGKILYESMSEIQLRRGASKHRLARNPDRTQGYAGSYEETGRVLNPFSDSKNLGRPKTLVNFERSIENYIETGVRYAKNKEVTWDIDAALKDDKFREKFPNAVGLSENLKDYYLGADKFLGKALDKAMIDLGVSTNLPREVLSSIAGMVMYTKVMALRVPFYIAQGLQDVFVAPRMLELQGKGVDGSMTKALLKGTTEWLSGKDRVEDIRWAVEYGIVDPKFAEQITFIPSIRGKKANLKDVVNTLTGNRLSAAIDQSIRLKSYLSFLNFFESAGIKGVEARELAARHSLDTMVEYESWKRSPMFREMGTAGNAFSPLSTFTNNLLNRLTEYTKDVGQIKSVKPLAAIAGTYLFLSGLYGFPFRQDIDNAIDLINDKFELDIPTPTDWLIKHSDTLGSVGLFGVPSAVSGQQLGGSLGSPEIAGSLVPMINDPVPKFAAENIGNAATVLNKGAAGSLTEAEKMKALKGVAPTAPGHGMIENYFSPQNRPRELSGALPQSRPVTIPQPNMEGGYTRSSAEQTARFFGMRSTDESLDQIKRFRVEAKGEMIERRRSRSVTNIVDGIISGDGIGKDAIKRFLENGGDSKDLLTTVENKVEARLLDARTRTLDKLSGHDMDAATYRKIKLLEEFKLYLGQGSKVDRAEVPSDKFLTGDNNRIVQQAVKWGKQENNPVIDNVRESVPFKPGTNAESSSIYSSPGRQVLGFKKPADYNILGLNDPERNQTWVFDHRPETLIHELGHSDQRQADKRLGKNFYESTIPGKASEFYGNKYNQIQGDVSHSLYKTLKGIVDTGRSLSTGQKVASNSWMLEREIYTTMREIDGNLPRGKRVWDLPEFKDIFKGKDGETKKKVLEELMFPQNTFADPGPEPKKEESKRSFLETIQNTVRRHSR